MKLRGKDISSSYLQGHSWSPSKLLFDKRIIKVAATHTFRTRNVFFAISFMLTISSLPIFSGS
jgi:hypothetical protein